MKRPRGNPNPGLARIGKKVPKKTCVNCGKAKLLTKFPKKSGLYYDKVPALDPKKYDTQCKLCKKPVPANAPPDYVHKEPKERNRQRGQKRKLSTKRSAKSKAKIRIETKMKSMLYLAKKGCEHCGERDPRKLEYDHKTPADKTSGVSRLINDAYSWASPRLRAEIRMCRVLCANCHRLHTIKQQGYHASDEVQDVIATLAAEHGFEV